METFDVVDDTQQDEKAAQAVQSVQQLQVEAGPLKQGFIFYPEVYKENKMSTPFTFEGSLSRPNFKDLVDTIWHISAETPELQNDTSLFNKWIEFAANTLGISPGVAKDIFTDKDKLDKWAEDMNLSFASDPAPKVDKKVIKDVFSDEDAPRSVEERTESGSSSEDILAADTSQEIVDTF